MRLGFFTATLAAIVGASTAMAFGQNIDTPARQAILLDVTSGAVLLEKDADAPMPPSSMSKMMTIYIAFEEIRKGKLSLDDKAITSQAAWKRWAGSEGSLMFLGVNEEVAIRDLLMGIIVSSGNDACTVLAEHLAGSEDGFAIWMNDKAKELGMTGSHFTNASGWPDPEQYVTARDLAILAKRTIQDFPDLYKFYSELEFVHGISLDGKPIRQSNRNPIMTGDTTEPRAPVRGADGLKTGHTSDAGYGFVGSAQRDDRRLVLVVNGLGSKRERASESAKLIEWGFRTFENYTLFKAGETVDTAGIWLGNIGKIPLIIDQDITLALSRQARSNLKVVLSYDGPLAAPIAKGEEVAQLTITATGRQPQVIPLKAGMDVRKISGLPKIKAAFDYLIWGASSTQAQ